MKRRSARTALIVTDAFLALSAIGGGIGLLAGWTKVPVYLLQGSPFPDYTLPAILLASVVGGLALVGCLATLNHEPLAFRISAMAGLAVMGFVAVEAIVIGTAWLQLVYFIVGVLIVGLAVYLRAREAEPAAWAGASALSRWRGIPKQ
jgi:hypothetical protein